MALAVKVPARAKGIAALGAPGPVAKPARADLDAEVPASEVSLKTLGRALRRPKNREAAAAPTG